MGTEPARTDVAVIGLGAMGAATLYQLALRGASVLGIDRFAPPHDQGSSHGETRITRCAVGEGDSYVPFVLRSHAIWRALEAETGETLLDACGLLMMAPRGVRTGHHGKTDFLGRTIGVAQRHGIAHELLDGAQVAARFPAFRVAGDEEAYLEPGGGFVHPERCIAAQLRRAAALGATIRTGCTVQAVRRMGRAMLVETDAGPVLADQVVVAAGAWAGKLLGPPFDGVLVPRRQVLHWFPVEDEALFRPGSCPAYIWMHGAQPDDYFYGFPALPGAGAVKVATEQYAEACDPDTADRSVSPQESAAMYEAHIAGRLSGARPGPARAAACLYTVTPDSGFVIDRDPENDRVVLVSPCSGHGFKHSAGIGEAVAQLVTDGRSDIDLGPFRFGRLVS
ncbi:N-methyl-L-tryptophan oxidase [Roseomonas hellenica]|uniref:N-methyl-L-tryptophan oxidase n=1 Tax=Plastoroseomonas hellenica TaxID=2687306 RepID=A0ABS5EU02_9PROT|nr:N-methyl-L-tryptophan oxidase [Plastoroseomonas hellenica]MBR0663771.1 N-methyl-L-tryptophan oxidase [Plastoroseomonas hellenica]